MKNKELNKIAEAIYEDSVGVRTGRKYKYAISSVKAFYRRIAKWHVMHASNGDSILNWVPRSILPSKSGRVLAFSPCYPKGKEMRVRILEGRFLRMCKEATHWAVIPEPANAPTPKTEMSTEDLPASCKLCGYLCANCAGMRGSQSCFDNLERMKK